MLNFYLLWELTKADFKLRYSGSVIGYLWALLKPLLMFLILNFVFSNVFRGQLSHYSLNLLVGIVLWTYFTEGTTAGMNSLFAKAPLISKVATSQATIIIAATLQATITFAINVLIVVMFFIYYQVAPAPLGILYTILFFILAYILIVGTSLILAPLFIRYRDVNQIWEVLLTLGFYASPIIYPLNVIPDHLQKFLWLNPMSYLINYVKLSLVSNQLIPPSRLAILIAATITTLLLGTLMYRHQRRHITEYL